MVLLLPEAADRVLYLQRALFVLMQEGIDIEDGGEVEDIVDLLRREGVLIIDDAIDLEEEGLGRLLDPTMLLHPNHLSFLVAVVVDVRDGDLLAGLVEVLVLDVDEEQAEELLLRLVNLC